MKRIFILILILCSVSFIFSQVDSIPINKEAKNRYVVWVVPSDAKNIYGIAIGLVGSEAICNRPYTKFSHGLNIQIPGQGFFQTLYFNKLTFIDFFKNKSSDSLNPKDTLPKRAIHNGVLISLLGTFTDQVNGVSFSLWMSMGKKVNGISCNFIWNFYEQINGVSIGLVNHTLTTNGVQIGLINKTKKLNGFQFGLWNKNEKRGLPLINWNFTHQKP